MRPLVASTGNTTAALALLGDNRFLFSNNGRCGIMCGVRGRSWVALGDPSGEEASQAELIWAFRELSDRHGGWAAFYQVGTEHASIHRDIGLGQYRLLAFANLFEGAAKEELSIDHARWTVHSRPERGSGA